MASIVNFARHMASTLLRAGSIAQIVSVLLFVIVSARVCPVYTSMEATTMAPVVEDGMSSESKVVATPQEALTTTVLLVAASPVRTTGDDSGRGAAIAARSHQHSILRL